MRYRNLLLSFVTVLLAAVLYLLTWPVAIDPGYWAPPATPALVGPLAQNNLLATTQRLGEAQGRAPEDIAVDATGKLYAGYEDGKVFRFDPDGSNPKLLADTGGRPLGLAFDPKGNLIICDSFKGLLSLSPTGELTTLATEAGGIPFKFTDDLDVAADGTIYFTDASWKFGQANYIDDLVEHRPNGRLLAWHPESGSVSTLIDELHFANGVAVSPEQDYLLVVETGKYRVLRYWLRGPKQGSFERFVDNLPGFPDGVARGSGGIFWLTIAVPRDPMLDSLMPRPWLRKVIMRLPAFARPVAKRYSMVLGIDGTGAIVRNYQDPDAAYAPITNAVEVDGHLYFGSIEEHGFGRWKLPASE